MQIWQVLRSQKILLQSVTGITKCEKKLLQNVTLLQSQTQQGTDISDANSNSHLLSRPSTENVSKIHACYYLLISSVLIITL